MPFECICEALQTEILISLFGVMYFCPLPGKENTKYKKEGERKRDRKKVKGRKGKEISFSQRTVVKVRHSGNLMKSQIAENFAN